jgi:hypothetical protein
MREISPTYIRQIAELMDQRKERLGEHAASSIPAWAVSALGPVTEEPAARPRWRHRAASIGAYRETADMGARLEPGAEPSLRADQDDRRGRTRRNADEPVYLACAVRRGNR